MPLFFYRVKTHEGEVVDSTIEAETRHQALAMVHQRVAGVVVSFREEGAESLSLGGAPALPGSAGLRLRHGRIRPRDLTTFFRQMSVSVNAGLPLRESLEAIIEDMEHASLRRVLVRVSERLNQGASFSQAMAEEGKVFPNLCIALVRTAEEAGTMAKTLDDLATNLEKTDALARKIRSIMAYPAFIAGFFVLVMLIMTFFILPQFQDIFSESDAELPMLTRVVFGVNKFIIGHVVVEAVVLVLLIAAFLVWRSTAAGRLQLDRLKLAMPGFGVVIRQISIARFSKHFAMMVRGGVPIAAGLEIAAAIVVNKVIENGLLAARENIMLGSDIASSLARQEVFPRLLVRMVSIGEASGRLPETLEKVAESYESQVEGAITVATALLEPVIIVFFGAIVLLLVLSVYLPVFTMASHMK